MLYNILYSQGVILHVEYQCYITMLYDPLGRGLGISCKPAYCSLPSAAPGAPYHAQQDLFITRQGHDVAIVSRIIIPVPFLLGPS